ncbi:MAG TPA: hypothetical protein VGG81_12935 [Edaphobacter sp.]|jgi:hypothetical protein
MKHQPSFYAAVLTLSMIYLTQVGASQTKSPATDASPITIALSAPTDSIKLEQSSIPILITLTNTGNTPVHLTTFRSGGEFLIVSLRFTLTLDGSAAPKAGLNKNFDHADGSIDRIRIDPGQVKHIPIDIKKLFDVTKPGVYLFSITMPPNMDRKVEVHSQPLRLNVVTSQQPSR